MKMFLLFLLLVVTVGMPARAATHQVTNSGYTFSPSTLTINAGDTVVFTLESIHNAVEVTQATWNAGGTTPLPGGFGVDFGGGTVVITQPGLHYYVCQNHAPYGMKATITVNAVTGVAATGSGIPKAYVLHQSYPNPFNPSTSIRYELPSESSVLIRVFNILGQPVATLVNGIESAGEKQVRWDAGSSASGVYFVRFEAVATNAPSRSFSDVTKVVLQK